MGQTSLNVLHGIEEFEDTTWYNSLMVSNDIEQCEGITRYQIV
jgi:hypothetical protein